MEEKCITCRFYPCSVWRWKEVGAEVRLFNCGDYVEKSKYDDLKILDKTSDNNLKK